MTRYAKGDRLRLVNVEGLEDILKPDALAEVTHDQDVYGHDLLDIRWLTTTKAPDGRYYVHRFESDPEDAVEHPAHYKQLPVEVIEITKRFDFLLGNVLKYVLRHEHKGKPLEDLKKAQWYLAKAIAEREAKCNS